MTGAGFGLLISVTIAISAAIGALIGFVAAWGAARFYRLRVEQLLRERARYRSNGREAGLFFSDDRSGRAGRAQETSTPV